MGRMRRAGLMRGVVGAVSCSVLVLSVVSCGGATDRGQPQKNGASSHRAGPAGAETSDSRQIPQVGGQVRRQIPADSRQVVAVYGTGKDSAEATATLFAKRADGWHGVRTWAAHNGRKGWTSDHHEGDKRSPVGVFTLSDAGGVLSDPDARLPYTASASFQAPHYWPKPYWHDFDYVIAIDYNRLRGTAPTDPTRPEGQAKGGGIWLHMDHGSGTSGCVSLPKAAMAYLLRTLDPGRHPVIVMGDRADLMS